MFIDARIPILFDPGDMREVGDMREAAVLIEGAPVPAAAVGVRFDLTSRHAPGCACCLPRGPVAEALTSLFTRRARGELPFFRTVQAVGLSSAGQEAVLDALANDPVASARFRLG